MYFLAIVAKQDLLRGNIVPSYILCLSRGESETRSPWIVFRANVMPENATKVLVKWPTGSDIMVDFLSRYRTRDIGHTLRKKMHEKSKKYYPEGALFWFECNDYGEITGPAVFVKTVPDNSGLYGKDEGKKRLEAALAVVPTAADLFKRAPFAIPLPASDVKPRLYQHNLKKCEIN